MEKISVVINTINEEENLPRAIASVKGLAQEIIVVDMHSTDKTVEVAKKLGAKVYDFDKVGYVEPARNFAVSKAENKWIFILDADEELSESLKERINAIIETDEADYVRIPRKNIVFGKWIKHSRWWPDYNIRLFKKGFVTWNEVIHSVPITTGVGIDITEGEEFAILHHHYNSIEQYVEKLNRYTTLHAKNHLKDGYKLKWQDLVSKPVNEFLSRFFYGEGYKDGIHGLALSGLQAFSEFVMYLKIWTYSEKSEISEKLTLKETIATMKNSGKDISYWQADALYKKYGGILNLIKRKFKLG